LKTDAAGHDNSVKASAAAPSSQLITSQIESKVKGKYRPFVRARYEIFFDKGNGLLRKPLLRIDS